MAAELAGTAAIRLVPSLANFRSRAQTELSRQRGLTVDVDVRPQVNTAHMSRQLERFRAKEEADAINLKARIDEADFKRSFQRVEHVFERSAFAKALRLQIKVIGVDALYGLTAAAGSAASALQSVAGAGLLLPAALGQAGVAAGVLKIAFQDVTKAITALQTEQDQAEDKQRALTSAQADAVKAARDVQRAQQDVGKAIRDTIRDYEDLQHSVRAGSLDEADALLNVQESYDKLAKGGFSSITELRRAQLGLLRDQDNLQQVRLKNKRGLEDYNDAQQKGVAGSDRVTSALDAVADAQNRVADAASRMADATQTKSMTGAFARLSPSAQEFAHAIADADSAWNKFGQSLQEPFFQGQAKNLNTFLGELDRMGPVLQGVAGELGGVFTTLTNTLNSPKNFGSLQGIINDTRTSVATIRQGIDPLVTGFLRLADVGGNALPRLFGMFNMFFTKFDQWTAKVTADGSLDRWIDQGIKGFGQLVDMTTNLSVTVFAIADAWRLAGGQSTGMIGDADKLSAKMRAWATGEGMGSMVKAFKDVRGWMHEIEGAFKDLWPSIKEIGSAIHEWSAVFLGIIGDAAQLTHWIQEHTGLVKVLVEAYLTIRTVKPFWDALTAAGTAYQNMMLKMSAGNGPMGQWARNSIAGLSDVQTAMGRSGTAAQTLSATHERETGRIGQAWNRMTSPVRNWSQVFSGAVSSAGNDMARLRGGLEQTSGSMVKMGDKADSVAANKIGSQGGKGLFGAMAGLARFAGPGLIFTGALMLAETALDKLGESHRKAAADADKQKQSLDMLKGSIDSITGSATQATRQQVSKSLQSYNIPGLGNRNILQDTGRAGLAPDQLVNLTDPSQSIARDQKLSELDKATAGRIRDSEEWKRFGPRWEKAGISLETMAKASSGDEAAKAQVEAAEKRMLSESDPMSDLPAWAKIAIAPVQALPATADAKRSILHKAGAFPGSLTDVLQSAGIPDSATTAIALRDQSRALTQAGQQTQQASAAANGNWQMKPGNPFGRDAHASGAGDGTGTSVVEFDPTVLNPPLTAEAAVAAAQAAGDSAEILMDGRRVKVHLSPEHTAQYTQKLAEGGMVRGSGTGTSDSNVVHASRGEYVIRKTAVDALGSHFLNRVNEGRLPGFWTGGPPFPLDPAPAPPGPTGGGGIVGGSATTSHFGGVTGAGTVGGGFMNMGKVAPVGTGVADKFEGAWGNTGGGRGRGYLDPRADMRVGEAPLKTPVGSSGVGRASLGVPVAPAPPPVIPKGDGPQSFTGPPTQRNLHFVPPAAPAAPSPVNQPPRPAGVPPRVGPGSSLVPLEQVPGWGPQAPAPHGGGDSVPGPVGPGASPGVITPPAWVNQSPASSAPGAGIPGVPTAGIPGQPLTGSRFPGTERGLQVNTLKSLRAVSAAFPEITDIGGVRADALKWHPNGLALDIMIPGGDTHGGANAPGKALGDRIWSWMGQHAGELGIDMGASLWQTDQGGNHYTHIHLASTGGGYPTGAETFTMPADGSQVLPGMPGGLPIPATAGGAGGILNGIFGGGSGSGGKGGNPMDPANVSKFLSGQAQHVGQTLASTGLSFIQGFTGLDFSGLVGAGQQIGGGLLGKGDGSTMTEGDAVDQQVVGDLQDFQNFIPTSLSANGTGNSSQGGSVDQWDSTIDAVIKNLVSQGLIDAKDAPAWKAAVKRQMKYESGGKNVDNHNDSDGKGGTQSVFGLMQMLPSTFSANVPPGYSNNVKDPVANIAASIMYAKSKGGPNYMTGVHGYATGGGPMGGPIRVSRGEYRMSPAAVSKYGAGFMGRLNSFSTGGMVGLPGFDDGGMPFVPPILAPPEPAPAAAPAPAAMAGDGSGPVDVQAAASAPGMGAPPPPVPAPQGTETGSMVDIKNAFGDTPDDVAGQADQAMRGMGAVGPVGNPSQEYLAPGISGAIKGAFQAAGQAGATAAAVASAVGSMGASGGGAGPAGSLIAGGAQLAGDVVSGAVNILAAAGVGTIKGVGTQQDVGGKSLLPSLEPNPLLGQALPTQDQMFGGPMASAAAQPAGGPAIINQYFGGIHTQNMDEWQRRQQLLERQQTQPIQNAIAF